MSFGYWFCETFCLINFVGGIVFGAVGWKKYGPRLERIWKNISK